MNSETTAFASRRNTQLTLSALLLQSSTSQSQLASPNLPLQFLLPLVSITGLPLHLEKDMAASLGILPDIGITLAGFSEVLLRVPLRES